MSTIEMYQYSSKTTQYGFLKILLSLQADLKGQFTQSLDFSFNWMLFKAESFPLFLYLACCLAVLLLWIRVRSGWSPLLAHVTESVQALARLWQWSRDPPICLDQYPARPLSEPLKAWASRSHPLYIPSLQWAGRGRSRDLRCSIARFSVLEALGGQLQHQTDGAST